MHWCHDMCTFGDMIVVAFGRFTCSWDDGSVKVTLRVDSASSKLLLVRCLSPLCSLACITVAFSMCM